MRLPYTRQLDEYPTGRKRLRLLAMTVLAIMIGWYEGQIAPVVPLLLEDLDISLATYGAISALALVGGATASAVGGRLTDHFGRVRLLVPLMMLTSVCCFAMTLVHDPGQLLLVRTTLSIVDGMAMAGTAPLIRDFSPRMGRAQAFGFWSCGTVGANFLAAAIAGVTLPLFDYEWRSQFYIMSAVSLIVSIVIAFNIAELSPPLRERIHQTELQALSTTSRAEPVRARKLFQSATMWFHVIGISLWLVLFITLNTFGQTMVSQAFGVNSSVASGLMAAFWVLNLVTLVVVGRISDRLQLRKPFQAGATLISIVLLGYLIVFLMGDDQVDIVHLLIVGMLLGGTMGAAYSPWMANFSEDAEDLDPRLQGSAWGVFGFLTKGIGVLALLVIPLVVDASSWQVWLLVSLACLVLFVPTTLFFGGPWRRRATDPDLVTAPD